MKNNLERFIRDNREAFDADEPSIDLWARIEPGITVPEAYPNGHVAPMEEKVGFLSRLDTPPEVKPLISKPFAGTRTIGSRQGWSFNWWVAASVALLALLGGFWFLNHQYAVTEQPEMLAISPGYAKEFAQYTRLVDQKQDELKAMTASNPALYKAFSSDLDRLERSYQTLKADLPANPNQEMLVQAMIRNLQLQIDLLNEQLRVIQRMKSQNNKENGNLI
jgi:hypothetical protein